MLFVVSCSLAIRSRTHGFVPPPCDGFTLTQFFRKNLFFKDINYFD